MSRVFIELAPCCREEKVLKMSIALHCVLLQVRKNVMKDRVEVNIGLISVFGYLLVHGHKEWLKCRDTKEF